MTIKAWNAEVINERQLTTQEKQVVLGTLLGTGSIIWPKKSKHPHLQMRQSKEDEGKWLRCKAEYLKAYSRPTPFSEDSDSYRWSSVSDKCWEEFYNLAYTHGEKKVRMEWLDQLTDMGLAVWYIDKGYMHHEQAHLKTSRFGKAGTALIARYFNEVGCACTAITDHGLERIRFSVEGSRVYYKLILPCFPKYLR